MNIANVIAGGIGGAAQGAQAGFNIQYAEQRRKMERDANIALEQMRHDRDRTEVLSDWKRNKAYDENIHTRDRAEALSDWKMKNIYQEGIHKRDRTEALSDLEKKELRKEEDTIFGVAPDGSIVTIAQYKKMSPAEQSRVRIKSSVGSGKGKITYFKPLSAEEFTLLNQKIPEARERYNNYNPKENNNKPKPGTFEEYLSNDPILLNLYTRQLHVGKPRLNNWQTGAMAPIGSGTSSIDDTGAGTSSKAGSAPSGTRTITDQEELKAAVAIVKNDPTAMQFLDTSAQKMVKAFMHDNPDSSSEVQKPENKQSKDKSAPTREETYKKLATVFGKPGKTAAKIPTGNLPEWNDYEFFLAQPLSDRRFWTGGVDYVMKYAPEFLNAYMEFTRKNPVFRGIDTAEDIILWFKENADETERLSKKFAEKERAKRGRSK